MYVCMYVCVYIYMHVCMYICMCVYIYIYILTQTYIVGMRNCNRYTHMYTYMHIHTYAYIVECAHLFACIHTHTRTYMHIPCSGRNLRGWHTCVYNVCTCVSVLVQLVYVYVCIRTNTYECLHKKYIIHVYLCFVHELVFLRDGDPCMHTYMHAYTQIHERA
jgi:hypothetical protein